MVPKKIPKRIIQNAAGIAVFTCMRNGLWMTGSGGSGILIARKSDGTWSSPSGIMLHTPTLSFIIGVDIYDCVLVINSLAALESITRPRVTLGEDVGLASGTLVPLDSPETEINLKELGNTVMAYMKARGQDQRVNLHGCILTERSNENERFYESPVSQMDILSGDISRHVEETQPLLEVIKLAEGRTDFDAALVGKVAKEPAPGDAVIASPSSTPASPRPKFGHQNADDPDPFGILALEMAGLEIREAGTRLRPTSSQLDFHPRPASQLSKIHRQSGDTYVTRSNRESALSTRTVKSQVTDAYTQTDTANTPETSPSPGRSEDGQVRTSFEGVRGRKEGRDEEEEIDYTTVDLTALKHLSQPAPHEDFATTGIANDPTRLGPPSPYAETDRSSKVSSAYGSNYGDDEDKDHSRTHHQAKEDSDADDEDDESDDEEPVVFEVATVQTTSTQAVASRMVHAKGNMVTIPKRIPPPLPVRNPARASLASKSDLGGDTASLRSPLRQAFSEADLNAPAENQESSTIETRQSADDKRPQSPLPSGLKTEVPRIEEPELDTPTNDKVLPVDSKPTDSPPTEAKESLDDSSEKASVKDQTDDVDSASKSQTPVTTSHPEDSAELSDSHKKGRLSVDTKGTDDASSLDESSYTTPTSERRFSFPEKTELVTPKKEEETQQASSDEATPTKLQKDTPNGDATEDGTQAIKTTAPTTTTTIT